MRTRRQTLQHSAAVAGLLLGAGLAARPARAFTKAAFDSKTVAEALRAWGAAAPQESRDVLLQTPDIAENGAAVQLTLGTRLGQARRLLLLVERNPSPMVAMFELNEAVEPSFQLRIKMAESSNVYAVALLADGRALFARREVRVTIGGCGN